MEVRGRWWNGLWGRMARRDIWLMTDGRRWLVLSRHGGDEGREATYECADETRARAMVSQLIRTSPQGQCRDLSQAVRQHHKRHG